MGLRDLQGFAGWASRGASNPQFYAKTAQHPVSPLLGLHECEAVGSLVVGRLQPLGKDHTGLWRWGEKP